MIHFLAGGGTGAFVKFAVQRGIELEEIEALHVEPLVKEASDKLVGAGVGDQAIDLLAENVRIGELSVAGEVEQLAVRGSTPKEVGKTHGEFPVSEFAVL